MTQKTPDLTKVYEIEHMFNVMLGRVPGIPNMPNLTNTLPKELVEEIVNLADEISILRGELQDEQLKKLQEEIVTPDENNPLNPKLSAAQQKALSELFKPK